MSENAGAEDHVQWLKGVIKEGLTDTGTVLSEITPGLLNLIPSKHLFSAVNGETLNNSPLL